MKLKNLIAATLLIAASQLASAGIFGQPDSIGANQGGIIGGIIGDVGDDDIPKLYVSQYEALRIAKQWYGNRTDVDYYIGGSTLIDNEYESNASELPDSSAWVRTGHHWLIVVDEHPNQNWSHECGYIYVQSEKSRLTPIKSCRVPGRMLPSGVGLTLTDANNPYGTNADLKPSVPLIDNAGFNAEFAGKTHAMIINSASTRNDNLERYCNDCSFIYQMLWKQYNVPTANIKLLMPIDTLMRRANGSGYVAMPTNIAQTVYPLRVSTISSCLNELKQNMTGDSRLMVFITGNAGITDSGEPFIMLPGGEWMMASEINAMFRGVNARVIDYVLGVSNAAAFTDYLSDKGRVITAATGVGEAAASCPDTPFSEFLWHWTSAQYAPIAYAYPNGYDPDNNGRVTLEEAFAYADSLSVNSNGTISTENQYLIEDVAFNNIPEAVDLYIRDTLDDTGKEPSCLEGTAFWNSPDIWIRQNNDGLTNHQSEFILIDNADDDFLDVYVYVRVFNRGQDTYPGHGMYVNTFWCNQLLNTNVGPYTDIKIDYDVNLLGSKIYSREIYTEIAPGDSAIVGFKFNVPPDLLRWNRTHSNNRINLSILAVLSNSGNVGADSTNKIETIDGKQAKVRESNDIAQSSKLILHSGDKAVIYPPYEYRENTHLHEIVIEAPDELIGNQVQLSFELSPRTYAKWQTNGSVANDVVTYSANPRKLYFNNRNSSIGNIFMNESSDSIVIALNRMANIPSYNGNPIEFNVIQKDMETGAIIAGFTVHLEPGSIANQLLPEVSIENDIDSIHIMECNIEEPAEYEWYDNSNNLISTGKSIRIKSNTLKEGEYKLKVTTDSDKTVAYKQFEITALPVINSISQDSADNGFTVRLNYESKNNTHIIVSSVSASTIIGDFRMNPGEREITIQCNSLTNGAYIISVAENGIILDSMQLVK